MKIEIDLKEILTDEFGNEEGLAETIKQEIVSILTKSLAQGIKDKVNEKVTKLIEEQIKGFVVNQIPSLFVEIIDKEYQSTGNWGEKGKVTTMRNRLIEVLTTEMTYKKCNYASDKNFFTRNIDEVVAAKCEEFKNQFEQEIDELFTKEALSYAVAKLKDKLGMGK